MHVDHVSVYLYVFTILSSIKRLLDFVAASEKKEKEIAIKLSMSLLYPDQTAKVLLIEVFGITSAWLKESI